MVNADEDELPRDSYTHGNGVLDVALLFQKFAEGCSITLGQLHDRVPALRTLCRRLEQEFSARFQTNIYMTPAASKGFRTHYDTHDVFVMQIAGTKSWDVYGTPVELPLPSQHYDSTVHEAGEVTSEFTLFPGDTAYIPRGIAHGARAGEEISLHLTVGVLSYTWTDFLIEVLSAASLRDSYFRKSLPVGFARTDFDRAAARSEMMARLARLGEIADSDEALDGFVDAFVTTRSPLLRGQLHQLMALEALSLDSIVGARAAVVSRQVVNDETVQIKLFGRTLDLPAHTSEAVRFALATPRFRVADLPGSLDGDGKMVLVRRLIREGLLGLVD